MLEGPVGALGLSVGLSVIGRRDVELDTEEFHEGLPEGRLEARIAIRDDGVRNAVKSDDLEEELGCSQRIEAIHVAGEEVDHLAEAVDNNKDCGKAGLCLREVCDEVHGDRRPRAGRNSERVERAIRFVRWRLDPLAEVACLDVVADHVVHTWPIVVSTDDRQGLVCTKMSTKGTIVVFAKDLKPKLRGGQEESRAIFENEAVLNVETSKVVVLSPSPNC